ncbi:STAS/SEC14 domain-containing protein [Bacillus sp. M6-12]|uniref:STAS/SEC14 domain-containing protein n=1 Tax=Bacillus sp. M6-12 TaxID=2054166 RepID=UPI000C7644CE|nr:STAS/SEC14 domain-containing protein [Bacillus sp. M6-12]PLS15967.1 STAS/SEC14 domain-containing protein [Bacillus sp. M6-12]
MLTILQSRHAKTIALEFEGKATKEDAVNLDSHVKERFKDSEEFNILAIMHDVDGSTLKGMTNGIKFDAKRWKQFNKFAVISEKEWIGTLAELGKYLPGIESKHFRKDELEEAWEWIAK